MRLELKIDRETVEECVIYEGDTPELLARKIAGKHKLSEEERKSVATQLQQYFQ